MDNDVINMVNKNHQEYRESVNRALKDSEVKLKNRVSNDKGQVIGVVTFDLNYFNNIKNKIGYVFRDRKRAQEIMAKFAVAGVITFAVAGTAMNIGSAIKTREETEALAESISDQKVMTAIESPSLDDDQSVLDYYLSSVTSNPMTVEPNEKVFYDDEILMRLRNLQDRVDSLRESETLGVDMAAKKIEYKKEFEAIARLMEEKGRHYNYDESLEEAKSQKL